MKKSHFTMCTCIAIPTLDLLCAHEHPNSELRILHSYMYIDNITSSI